MASYDWFVKSNFCPEENTKLQGKDSTVPPTLYDAFKGLQGLENRIANLQAGSNVAGALNM